TGPTDHRVSPDRTNFARAQLIRAIMVRNGDASKPMWATEVGWNAIPIGHPDTPMFGRVDREEQARYAVEAYERAEREWPWMGVMNYWFFRRPSDAEKGQAFYYFALMEPDFTPWPAYEALREYLNRPPVVYPGQHQEDHWALDYSSGWESVRDATSVLGGYRLGQPGARLRFTFWGSELDLLISGRAAPADVKASVDGVPVRPRPLRIDGRAGLALVRRVAPGDHIVELEVGSEGLALDAVVVRRTDRRGAYLFLATVATAAACLALVLARHRAAKGRVPAPKGRADG
ncbi:MAG: hypothetical protein QME94_19905, partial [Anaerolineae bacterium]|nr:hypothetical protein [Anaerolineae bacterium]